MNLKTIALGGLAVIALLLMLVIAGVKVPLSGAVNPTGPIHYQMEQFTQGLEIGQRSSGLTNIIATTCNLIGTNQSQTASTSKAYDCAVTGAKSGDLVFAKLASSTPAVVGVPGWTIGATLASTTAGYITVQLVNQTGAAAIPAVTSVGSSTQVLIIRTTN